MSTSKTQNYQLHSWTPEDDFRLHEINENFTALDEALFSKVKPLCGSYTGTGEVNQHIELGLHPKVVIVMSTICAINDTWEYYALGADGLSGNTALAMDGTGFTTSIDYYKNVSLQRKGAVYHYAAFY